MSTNGSTTVNQQLYRLYGADGELLYIGISYSAIIRYAQHKINQPWIGDVARIDIETHPCTRAQIEQIEREAIGREHPKHNVTHAARPVTDTSPVDYIAVELCMSPYWHVIANALNDLRTHVNGRWGGIDYAQFVAGIQGLTRALDYGDSCPECFTRAYPFNLTIVHRRAQCRYHCPACWHDWATDWDVT